MFHRDPTYNTGLKALKAIHNHPGLSQNELAHTLGVNRSTMSKTVGLLASKKLIRLERTTLSESAQRKRAEIFVNEAFGCVAGISIQDRGWKIRLVSLCGSSMHQEDGEIHVQPTEPGIFLESLAKQARTVADYYGIPLLSVGFSLPGIINPKGGDIIHSDCIGVTTPFSLTSSIKASLRIPAFVENDVRSCAHAELHARKNVDPSDFLYVSAQFADHLPQVRQTDSKQPESGLTIGLALVINRAVHIGADYTAGEFRSIRWKAPNNTALSLSDNQAERILRDERPFARFSKELAEHVAFLANTVDVGEIVLGGSLPDIADRFIPVLEAEMTRWPSHQRGCLRRISLAKAREAAGAIGAARLSLEALFENPDEHFWHAADSLHSADDNKPLEALVG